jgi:hypothetical protein
MAADSFSQHLAESLDLGLVGRGKAALLFQAQQDRQDLLQTLPISRLHNRADLHQGNHQIQQIKRSATGLTNRQVV